MTRRIGVVGLGYVGLPVALAFSAKWPVTGFDINNNRVQELQSGFDRTGETSAEELLASKIHFTSDPASLRDCDFIVVAVPTPIDSVNHPDLTPLISASRIVGAHLTRRTIVVYESTVYPGTTEEVCVPELEENSGLTAGIDFFVGYSPERINPGDREHRFHSIVKIVAGQTSEVTDEMAQVYGSVVEAGIYRASSIKVAEAAKVIENTQRDLNIALMNELAIIFDRLRIDTAEVLAAASTKWNFIPFRPGLVGGHCIGVDPYYLTYKAESTGYHPQVILAGRRINDGMGSFIAVSIAKRMAMLGIPTPGATATVLGLTFKENIPDIRNTKVIDIVRELQDFGLEVQVADPFADPEEVERHYAVQLRSFDELKPADTVILAVPHAPYIDSGWKGLERLFKPRAVVADVKSALDAALCPANIELWRL